MKRRAKVFNGLAILTFILCGILMGLSLWMTPAYEKSANEYWIRARETYVATKSFTMVSVANDIIRSPGELAVAIQNQILTDARNLGIAIVVIALPLLLLAWRNHAGAVAEQRHAEQMSGLRAVYKALRPTSER